MDQENVVKYRAQRCGKGKFTRKLRGLGYRKMRRTMARASKRTNRPHKKRRHDHHG